MITRLVYASAATQTFDAATLAKLLTGARATNSKLGVGGVLLFHEGAFLQVLEGDAKDVDTLYAKIAKDPRHNRVLMLARTEVEKRLFADWTMGQVEIPAAQGKFLEGLNGFMRGAALDLQGAAGMVGTLLEGFRDGRYRQYVRGS